MLGQLRTYDFKQVAVIVGGIQIQGFVDGEAITIEPDADEWTETVGNDGEVTRSKSNNSMSRIMLKLAQSAESNQYLSGLRLSGGIVPVMVKDNSGLSIHAGEQAYVKSRPAAAFARESGEREWVIVVPNMVSVEGGN